MFCPKCGQSIGETGKFCRFCGTPILPVPPVSEAPPSKEAPATVVETPELPVYEEQATVMAPPVQHTPVRPAPVRPEPRPVQPVQVPPQKKRVNPLAIILPCVAGGTLLLLLIGLVWFLFFRADREVLQNEPFTYTVAPEEAMLPTVPAATDLVPEQDPMAENPYADFLYDPNGYLLPDSDGRYLCRSRIQHLSREELMLAYHEIDARHGAVFQDPALQQFFEAHNWYTPGASGEKSHMEITNQELIQANLDLLDGSIYRSGNKYIPYLGRTEDQVLPDSRTRYLTAADLESATEEELMLLRNEIYARHGYIFNTEALREFFYCKDWYQPSTPSDSFNTSVFSDIEEANVNLIRVYEKLLEGIDMKKSNPYYGVYSDYFHHSEEIFPRSSTEKLSQWDLVGMTPEALVIARNEIYARNGYAYENQDLLAYFAQCSWYRPSIAPGRKKEVPLNSIEKYNIDLMQEYEDYLEDLGDIPNPGKLNDDLTYDFTCQFFELSLPAYWKDYCVIEEGSGNGGYWYSFYEKFSYQQGAGHLFTINVVPDQAYLYEYPHYEDFCTLVETDGTVWYVMISYPTDVQFNEPALQALYTHMYNACGEILDTLISTNDYVLHKPYA